MALVKQHRKLHPRLGTRKLVVVMSAQLADLGISLGRDRLFRMLRERGLLIKRRRGMRTTDSRHGFRIWPNLVRNVVPAMVNQVWVSDITFIRTEEGFMYLALVMDAFSRKIVGYNISESLAAEGCIGALKMALEDLPAHACPIHHSDRGLQYCCHDYIVLLEKRGSPISMTEINHCYENAKAERLNGILKQEYLLGQTFRDKKQAAVAGRQAVLLYNACRPHISLGYRTPELVHAAA